MGWLIEALANVFLEILGDMMSWMTTLLSTFYLDIGMEPYSPGAGPGSTPRVPEFGTLINPMEIKGYLLESVFPMAKMFCPLFVILGMSIIAFIFLTKMAISFGGPFVKTEPGLVIVGRTGLAIFGTMYAYTIFIMLESLFNRVYNMFLNKFVSLTEEATKYSTDPTAGATTTEEYTRISEGGTGAAGIATTPDDAFSMFGKDLIKDMASGQGWGVTIIAIVLFSILLISFMKLVLEIYERYVLIGVLFYTAPLAFSTIASKESNVFSSWVQMVISEFVVMCSTLFFTGVFIASWTGILNTEEPYLFLNSGEFVTTMLLMIAWLIIGQQFDQHLKSLGLATAQTGRGLGGAVMAGLGTAAAAAHLAAGAIKSGGRAGYNVATGQAKWQNPGGRAADFVKARNGYSGMSKADADRQLSKIQQGKDKAFSSLSADKQTEALRNLASASMGSGNFSRALSSNGLDPAGITSASFVSKDGKTTGAIEFKGANGSVTLQSPGGMCEEYGKMISGTDWSTPVTHDEMQRIAAGYKAEKYDADNNYWSINEDDLTRLDYSNPAATKEEDRTGVDFVSGYIKGTH